MVSMRCWMHPITTMQNDFIRTQEKQHNFQDNYIIFMIFQVLEKSHFFETPGFLSKPRLFWGDLRFHGILKLLIYIYINQSCTKHHHTYPDTLLRGLQLQGLPHSIGFYRGYNNGYRLSMAVPKKTLHPLLPCMGAVEAGVFSGPLSKSVKSPHLQMICPSKNCRGFPIAMFDYRRVSDVQPHDGHISLPALQWRQGSICPSCGRGRMHSGGEHEWQMQRPHLRQWCFLRSNQKSAWVMWQVQRHTGDAHLNGGVFFWGNEA